MNLLQELEAISERREDGGMFHGGHVHFIQNRCGDDGDGMKGFVLKAGIYGVLELVPERIPLDLPIRVQQVGFEPSEDLVAAINEVNANLIVPLSGYDVVQIIKAAREYIDLAKADAAEAN